MPGRSGCQLSRPLSRQQEAHSWTRLPAGIDRLAAHHNNTMQASSSTDNRHPSGASNPAAPSRRRAGTRTGPADPAALLGNSRRRAGHHARRTRQRNRQRRAADHRAKPARERREFDLGRQRVSAVGDNFAAAAVVAGRSHRLPARLYGRAGAVHDRVARLRARHVAADARARPRDRGLRRGRHHERQHCARADDLSARAARTWRRDQRDGGRRLVRRRADGGIRRTRRRGVAVALRDQRADRHCRHRSGLARAAAQRRTSVAVRLSERRDERVRVRA